MEWNKIWTNIKKDLVLIIIIFLLLTIIVAQEKNNRAIFEYNEQYYKEKMNDCLLWNITNVIRVGGVNNEFEGYGFVLGNESWSD